MKCQQAAALKEAVSSEMQGLEQGMARLTICQAVLIKCTVLMEEVKCLLASPYLKLKLCRMLLGPWRMAVFLRQGMMVEVVRKNIW